MCVRGGTLIIKLVFGMKKGKKRKKKLLGCCEVAAALFWLSYARRREVDDESVTTIDSLLGRRINGSGRRKEFFPATINQSASLHSSEQMSRRIGISARSPPAHGMIIII